MDIYKFTETRELKIFKVCKTLVHVCHRLLISGQNDFLAPHLKLVPSLSLCITVSLHHLCFVCATLVGMHNFQFIFHQIVLIKIVITADCCYFKCIVISTDIVLALYVLCIMFINCLLQVSQFCLPQT